jgi:hypothetical protein
VRHDEPHWNVGVVLFIGCKYEAMTSVWRCL